MEHYMTTRSGERVDLLNPESATIWADDIAHSLSHLARFNGHTDQFYSVAQHSVLVYEIVRNRVFGSAIAQPARIAFAALLHDAHEAYTGDIVVPVKKLLGLAVDHLESKLDKAIGERFGLGDSLVMKHFLVGHADLTALATEKRDLHSGAIRDRWSALDGIAPLPYRVVPVGPELALKMFHDAFDQAREEFIKETDKESS